MWSGLCVEEKTLGTECRRERWFQMAYYNTGVRQD